MRSEQEKEAETYKHLRRTLNDLRANEDESKTAEAEELIEKLKRRSDE